MPSSGRIVAFRSSDVRFELPFDIRNYTDFYASIHHATNVGKKFRPDNPLAAELPARADRLSRASFVRSSSAGPGFAGRRVSWVRVVSGPTEQLDYELELGALIGRRQSLGQPISDHRGG